MKSKTALTLGIVSTGSLLVILVLFLISDTIVHRKNPFLRIYVPHPMVFSKQLDLKYDSYYIAGLTSEDIYLGNSRAQLHLLQTNYTLSDTQHVSLKILNIQHFPLKGIKVSIDSPHFYLTDGVMPGVFKGRINSWLAKKYKYDSAFFTESVPIGNSSFVIKTVSTLPREYVLAKEKLDTPYLRFAPTLLEKQVDGIFCKDGNLNYDRDLSLLVYVYHYRNQFICADTNLNLVYRGETIDTITKAQLKITEIKSKGITFAAPPLMVNIKSCVSGKYLFIHSNLQAKNEDKTAFEESAVIDVYSLKDGSYKFSFYLWDFGGKKVSHFKIYKDKLVAIYGKYLVLYDLQMKYFPK